MINTRECLSSTELLVKGKCICLIPQTYEDQDNNEDHDSMNIVSQKGCL